MSEEGVVDAAPEGREGRVSTGTPGLDAMLEGGLVPRRPYLIVGPSGTGKTTLALQFLTEGIRHGERGLLVTMEEPPNEMRINHRLLGPELLKVEVFDAIPDIMRYERVPFKDIASVRQAMPFSSVPLEIRRSPELTAVEVTMTALEQMLRSEVQRRTYSRLVIDSLTALQYFCMKGFEPIAGAQAFLRFLSDLHVTTILTVESPLEDADTPERMLARGEIRLFRWELEGRTVRAIGVEKFRGSSHDVRLHPYRIGPQGIDVNLDVTISRDTRQIIESPRPVEAFPTVAPASRAVEEAISPLDPLAEEARDLVLVGAEVAPLRTEIAAALRAASEGDLALARGRLSRANALVIGLSDSLVDQMKEAVPSDTRVAEAYQRILQRSEAARAGMPPTQLPPPRLLEVQLEWVLSLLPEIPSVPAAPPAPAREEAIVSLEPTIPPSTEEVPVDAVPEPTPAPVEAAVLPTEGIPEAPETLAARPEIDVSPRAPTEEAATETSLAQEVPAPAPAPASDLPEPATATPEAVPESPPPAASAPVSAEVTGQPPAPVPPPVEAAPQPTATPLPPIEVSGPAEEVAPETVEGILAAPGPPHAAPEGDEARSEPPEPAPVPRMPAIPAEVTPVSEVEKLPPTPPETAPAPAVETLPPPPSRDVEATVQPLRPWSPPALPTTARRPVPLPRTEVAASALPPARAKAPAVPPRAHERRPPLPQSVAGLPVPPERHLRLETVREARAVRPPAVPVSAAPSVPPVPPRAAPLPIPAPASRPAPAVPVPVSTAAAAPPKRKRKTRAVPSRKRSSVGAPGAGSPMLVPSAGRKGEAPTFAPAATPSAVTGGPVPVPSRPKRRPARKRKAPTVVAAHPVPAPSPEGGATSSAPPPLPTPPTPPPEDSSSSEENR